MEGSVAANEGLGRPFRPERRRHCLPCGCIWALVLVGVPLVAVASICIIAAGLKPLHFSAAINAVSGLDDLRGAAAVGALDAAFNLTLPVASRGFLGARECVNAGTTVEVAYGGVTLAGGPVPRLCSGARAAREERVVACGARVPVPGFVLDGLTADARTVAQAFDVTLLVPSTDGHGGQLVSCSGRPVGDAAAALRTPCDVFDVDTIVADQDDGGAS